MFVCFKRYFTLELRRQTCQNHFEVTEGENKIIETENAGSEDGHSGNASSEDTHSETKNKEE